MIRGLFGGVLAGMVLVASAASAAPLTINAESGDAQWHAFNGNAFFQGASWDGAGCNSGNWISNSGGCASSDFYDRSPGETPDYLGSGETGFDFVAQGSVTVQFLERLSSWDSVFGWIDSTGTHPLFTNTTNAIGSSFTFSPVGAFALYELTPDGFFSTNQAGRPSQFVVFNESSNCAVMGAEDIDRTHALNDHDFQDTIVRVCSSASDLTPVPEPATVTLLATGLCAGAVRWRRLRRKASSNAT
jgi:hypothetical protein